MVHHKWKKGARKYTLRRVVDFWQWPTINPSLNRAALTAGMITYYYMVSFTSFFACNFQGSSYHFSSLDRALAAVQ